MNLHPDAPFLSLLPVKKRCEKSSVNAVLSPPKKIIFIYSRSPDSISSAGSAFPVPRWHFGTYIHHTVERAVPDSHRIPFSMPWHHYICYRFIISQGPHYIPIDNFHNLIAISYDYLLVCIFYILGKKHSFLIIY